MTLTVPKPTCIRPLMIYTYQGQMGPDKADLSSEHLTIDISNLPQIIPRSKASGNNSGCFFQLIFVLAKVGDNMMYPLAKKPPLEHAKTSDDAKRALNGWISGVND